jgi:hypothetical protein
VNEIKKIYEKDFHQNIEKDKKFLKNEFKLANQLEWIKETAEKIEKENEIIQKIIQQMQIDLDIQMSEKEYYKK